NISTKDEVVKYNTVRRAIMFTDMPSTYSPSAHVNGAQFVSWFYSQGWELILLPPFPWKLFWWIASQKGLARLMWYVVLPIQRFFEVLFKTRGAHIVIVHKGIISMSVKPVFEALLRRRHKRIIFNFDDAVYEKGIPYVPERIALADAVWAGNPILVDYSKRYCGRVALIESAVDCNHYTAKVSYEIHQPLQLIWSGSEYGHQYLERLREPLKILSKGRRFVMKIVSGKKFSFNEPEIRDVWIPFDAQTEVQCLKNADIALMPITDGPYERAKENYKVKMYMACGLPLVCSPVGINTQFIKDGERGFFAKTSADWVRVIEQLADSQFLRERVGRVARSYVVDKYDIPVIGPQLIKLFDDLKQE
ncbi:MAG: glycosyltransferase, partial [Deltaproteobacteria bacterium]